MSKNLSFVGPATIVAVAASAINVAQHGARIRGEAMDSTDGTECVSIIAGLRGCRVLSEGLRTPAATRRRTRHGEAAPPLIPSTLTSADDSCFSFHVAARQISRRRPCRLPRFRRPRVSWTEILRMLRKSREKGSISTVHSDRVNGRCQISTVKLPNHVSRFATSQTSCHTLFFK